MRRSERKIERIINYRRVLIKLERAGETNIFSHQLSALTNATPAQIRRDLMEMDTSGSPAHGYVVKDLIKSINNYIGADKEQVAIIGLGNLGKAITNYVNGSSENLKIVAGFDIKSEKVNRVVAGCHSYHLQDFEKIAKERGIKTVILTVPVRVAQDVAEQVTKAGVRGILNYAPVNLHLSDDIYVENRDMISAVEKVAYFSDH
ncbi:MAG: redox-sensing transcriptional repressor Rex [Candidatus Marinimicrobia bacterium]|nr:redox-sensing transcriptional repressor Rex [Candidatus Neomarinimicrobiota bacterium]